MRRLLGEIKKAEDMIHVRTTNHIFLVVTDISEYEQLERRYENDEQTMCVVFKLYEE